MLVISQAKRRAAKIWLHATNLLQFRTTTVATDLGGLVPAEGAANAFSDPTAFV